MKKIIYLLLLCFAFNLNAQSAFFQSTTVVKNSNYLIYETWLFGVFGQSNILPLTGDSGISNDETYPEGTLQWLRYNGNDNTLGAAVEPLDHFGNNGRPDIGPGVTVRFANELKEEFPNVTIVFIPSAVGSTGFEDGQWNEGDPQYEDSVTRTNLCLSENPDFIYKGTLWQQGEDDAGYASYETALHNMINSMRSDITGATDTPFMLGGQVPARVSNGANAEIIENIIIDVPNNISNTIYIDPTTPTILTSDEENNLHYNSDSSLLLGGRYFDGFLYLLTNN